MSASVRADGVLQSGSDSITATSMLATGSYQVAFDRSIRGCSMVAGIGLSSLLEVPTLPAVSRGIRTGVLTGFQGILVSVTNPATGNNVNADFQLIVTCPPL